MSLDNQARPQQASKVFKEVTNVGVNSGPGETDPYGQLILTLAEQYAGLESV